jgi:ornithine cyclodeaminase/alanine dehydrogenase-like protein (mu-crystallin family)
VALGRDVAIWDVDSGRAWHAAEELGASPARTRDEALASDLLVTVTPGHELLLPDGSLAPGQHVSLMGADGPGKAEISPTELARTRIFCDDWEQASHGGELAHAVEAGLVGEQDVGRIGAVLAGAADGRRADAEITTFDSTGLALQDLAIALAAFAQVDGLELGTLSL